MSLQPSDSKGQPIAYFFHLRGKSLVQKSLRGMLMELIYQVLDNYPRFFELIQSIFLNLKRMKQNWDIQSLSQAVLHLPKLPPTVMGCRDRITLFIDALDENHNRDDNVTLLSIFDDLIATYRGVRGKPNAPVLKICLASRPWPIFQKRLGNNPRVPSFAIHDFTMQDIEQYTTKHIVEAFGGRQTSVSQLSTDVASRAKGVFIWVRIVVDNLSQEIIDGTPIESLQRILHKYPEELDDMYKFTLRRIPEPYHPQTLILLKIVLASRFPLTAREAYTVTYICLGGLPPNSGKEGLDDFISWLASRSGGLINAVDTGTNEACSMLSEGDNLSEFGLSGPGEPYLQVEFLHQTVQDFVHNGLDDSLELAGTKFPVAQMSGSCLLALSCLDSHPPHRHLRNIAKDIFSYIREVEQEEDGSLGQQITSLPHWESFDLHDFPFRTRNYIQSSHHAFPPSEEFSHYLDPNNKLTPMVSKLSSIPEDAKPFILTILHNLYRTNGPKYLFTMESAGSARDVCRFSLFFASVGPRLSNDRVDRRRMFRYILTSLVEPLWAKQPSESEFPHVLPEVPCDPITELVRLDTSHNYFRLEIPRNLASMFACLKPSAEIDDNTLLAFAEGLKGQKGRPLEVSLGGVGRLRESPMTLTALCSRVKDINRAQWVELFQTWGGQLDGLNMHDEHVPFVDLAAYDALSQKPIPHIYTKVADTDDCIGQVIASACIPLAVVGLGSRQIFRALYPIKDLTIVPRPATPRRWSILTI